MSKVVVKWAKIHKNAVIPRYAHHGDAGFDFMAVDPLSIMPGERILVKTGLKVELPIGYELQVRPRSGLSLKSSLIIANSPGTIDSNYRGEVCIIVWNSGHEPYPIKEGDRIAQGVIKRVPAVEFIEVDESDLSNTTRGTGGFGSTGINNKQGGENVA